MSDLFGTPEDRFYHEAAQILSGFKDYGSIKWHRDRTNTVEHVFTPREYSDQHGQPPSRSIFFFRTKIAICPYMVCAQRRQNDPWPGCSNAELLVLSCGCSDINREQCI